LPIGTLCTGSGGVAEYAMLPIAACNKVIPDIPLTWNLGPFSLLQGLTAWIGYKICNP
jgi:hypothetical protein